MGKTLQWTYQEIWNKNLATHCKTYYSVVIEKQYYAYQGEIKYEKHTHQDLLVLESLLPTACIVQESSLENPADILSFLQNHVDEYIPSQKKQQKI